MSSRLRFTLVELMIVVAIISILAAIAVPNFTEMQRKSKFAEVPVNTTGIVVAERGYQASQDATIWVSKTPSGTVGKQKRPWTTGTAFEVLGWAPDGDVYGAYFTDNGTGVCSGNGTSNDAQGTAWANSDIDGDGVLQILSCCFGGNVPPTIFTANGFKSCGYFYELHSEY